MFDELLHFDLAERATWKRYCEVLKNAGQYDSVHIQAWLDALEQDKNAALGYGTSEFLVHKAVWLLGEGQEDKALQVVQDLWAYRAPDWRFYITPPQPGEELSAYALEHKSNAYMRHQLYRSPRIAEFLNFPVAPTRFLNFPVLPVIHQEGRVKAGTRPFKFFERCPLPIKSEVDMMDPARLTKNGSVKKTLVKGDDVYRYRYYAKKQGDGDKLSASVALFDAIPEVVANRDKFLGDNYALEEFCGAASKQYSMPFMNYFFSTYISGTPVDVTTLLREMTEQRGGAIAYTIGTDATIHGKALQAGPHEVYANGNGEMTELLFILKKCGYIDAIFAALPHLPPDFPLLLMCFADETIRQRVEDYMRLPGLKAMYDMAFAPRRLTLKEQLPLVRFGTENPHFQELLAASLHTYGYYLYNNYDPHIDWHALDYAHFSLGYGGDVLLFLTSRADLLPPLRDLISFGPGTCFAHESVIAEGFQTSWVYLLRTILGHVAMHKDMDLNAWIAAYPESPYSKGSYKQIKVLELAAALRK